LGLDFDTTLRNAGGLIGPFRDLVRGIEHVPRAVGLHEMLFVRAAVGDYRPGQIVESGRALGQSTLLLALMFPDTPIVSYDLHEDHPDSPVALKRLEPYKNLKCLFGDSRVTLPRVTRAGDVVLIDGPKDLRAVRLAMQLIHANKPAAVFIHDCQPGSDARKFLERYVPRAFYSDEPRFRQKYVSLDSVDYFGVFACVPGDVAWGGWLDRMRWRVARMTQNFGRWASRRKEN